MSDHESRLFRLLAVAAVLLSLMTWPTLAVEHANQKPNIVLLFIDDLGYADTGPFGSKDIPTPHIDRLAKEGVVLAQTYVTNPPCCPSRSSLMMGMYGQKFGKYGMSRGLSIPEDKPTLAEFMRDGGYVTGQVGKWDLGDKSQGPSARGFMEVAQIPPRAGQEKKQKGIPVPVRNGDGGDGLADRVRRRQADRVY